MNRRAPPMFAFGFFMVLMQCFASGGVILGMVSPSCGDNTQCDSGKFCYTEPNARAGRCFYCGANAPVVPYLRDTGELITPDDPECLAGDTSACGFGPTGREVEMNRISTGSYPKQRTILNPWQRADEPLQFGGFNISMVIARCTPPFADFYLPEQVGWDDGDDGAWHPGSSREGVPDWIKMPSRGFGGRDWIPVGDTFSAVSQERWCDACTHMDPTGNVIVSTANEKRQAAVAVESMMLLDWSALAVCAYVVGLTVVSENKDMLLCEIAVERGLSRNKLTPAWRLALAILARVRAHTFIALIMSAVPVVIVSHGGSALQVCFNTVAVRLQLLLFHTLSMPRIPYIAMQQASSLRPVGVCVLDR